jgi:hypothetical protein
MQFNLSKTIDIELAKKPRLQIEIPTFAKTGYQ